MASHFLDHPLILTRFKVLTGVGDFTVVNETLVIVRKTVGAATTVTLPRPGSIPGRCVAVKDGAGDAATHAITVVGADGALIDGEADFVIATAYGSVMLFWDGTGWNVLGNTAPTGDGSL